MVGLSVVLEKQSSGEKVIDKTRMFINTKASHLNCPLPPFLQQCFLCKQKLLPGNDIYMYNEECRCRQIFMDEQESLKKDKYCSFATTTSSSTSSSSGPRRGHQREAAGDDGGGFAYRGMK
ncbi:Multidrug and toxin extrusion protein 1 [Hibiscus syriacus]|uniref:Multidrug and toxin extrusion protein 1 n=1 Tax=Hibiscus syriacus TaxID=106335 RepID=A0A6A2YDN3_HIBSY|nr:Multidrug and toxin extrusion protein 1 [Hibiscus syriacus]